jgi:hypothetical protein
MRVALVILVCTVGTTAFGGDEDKSAISAFRWNGVLPGSTNFDC